MHRIAKHRMFASPADASAQIHSLSIKLCLAICWGSGTLLTTVSSARSNFRRSSKVWQEKSSKCPAQTGSRTIISLRQVLRGAAVDIEEVAKIPVQIFRNP